MDGKGLKLMVECYVRFNKSNQEEHGVRFSSFSPSFNGSVDICHWRPASVSLCCSASLRVWRETKLSPVEVR